MGRESCSNQSDWAGEDSCSNLKQERTSDGCMVFIVVSAARHLASGTNRCERQFIHVACYPYLHRRRRCESVRGRSTREHHSEPIAMAASLQLHVAGGGA